jgi:hypothetical protein
MSYALYNTTYFDAVDKLYYNIITISSRPVGPLTQLVVPFKNNKVSAYSVNDQHPKCGLGFRSTTRNGLMRVDELPELFAFLFANGYTVDTALTTMVLETNVTNRLIAYIHIKN